MGCSVSPPTDVIFCDDDPAPDNVGFYAILGAVFGRDLPAPPLRLVSSRAAPSGAAEIVYLNLQGRRGASWPLWLRLPLILMDKLRIRFSAKLRAMPPGGRLCVWVGADWTSMLRGLAVARRSRAASVSVYVVDDIYALGRAGRLERKLRDKWLRTLLCRADRRFAITAPLADELERHSGRRWTVLDMPYRLDELVDALPPLPAPVTRTSGPTELVFIGSINFGIVPVLANLCRAMLARAARGEQPVRLNVVARNFLGLDDAVFTAAREAGLLTYHAGLPDQEVDKRFPRDAVFLCPYAGDDRSRNLVATSFPSKLLKTVTYRRPVLVIAPSYAAVRRSHDGHFAAMTESEAFADLDALARHAAARRPWEDRVLLARHGLARYLDAVAGDAVDSNPLPQ